MTFCSPKPLVGKKCTVKETPSSPFPFLDLPPEIRNTIYDIALADRKEQRYEFHVCKPDANSGTSYEKQVSYNKIAPRALTQTCRQIRNETIVQFYRANTFHISIFHFNQWLDVVGPYAAHIRRLKVGLACPCYRPWTKGGTLNILPISKFHLQFPQCRIGFLPTCASRTSKSKCRPAIPSQALLELRHGFELRGDEVRDAYWTRNCGILYPCHQGEGRGGYWRWPATIWSTPFTPSQLLHWDAYMHQTVLTYEKLMFHLSTRNGPWHALIESDILHSMSFQFNSNQWHFEGAGIRHSPLQKSDLGFKILQILNVVDDPRYPIWRKSVTGPKSKTLSTEELMGDGDWKDKLDRCIYGKPLTWIFYRYSGAPSVVKALRRVDLYFSLRK
ncbi:hypothetical protein EG328_010410 [Venturia inaequalis]|uniref:DUF7730 domain-containing protein n=1 Tax=Venturia inaequalis TaxID=5025 RepID=A0A8H3U6J4_VENIN|nr:hypothetical protein EG328_010410 [Venturia inaequalis]RDI83350.1 hypothetical protein Vi05172_g6657 [Venturia inaequalis]